MARAPEPKRAQSELPRTAPVGSKSVAQTRPTTSQQTTNAATSSARATPRSTSSAPKSTQQPGQSGPNHATGSPTNASSSNRRPPAVRDVKRARRRRGVFEPTPSWKRLSSLGGLGALSVLVGIALATVVALLSFVIFTALG